MQTCSFNHWFSSLGKNFNAPIIAATTLSITVHLTTFLYTNHGRSSLTRSGHRNTGMKVKIVMLPANTIRPHPENIQQKQSEAGSVKKNKSLQNKKPVNKIKFNSMETTTWNFPVSALRKTANTTRQNGSEQHQKNFVPKQEPIKTPSLVFAPPPDYPDEARWESRSGDITLQFHITKQGHVTNIEILKSSDHDDLDLAAIGAIQQWRYRTEHTDPSTWHQYTFHFKLQ